LSRGCAPSRRKAYRRRRPECPQERPSLQSARRIARPEIRRAVGRLDHQWEAALTRFVDEVLRHPKGILRAQFERRRAAMGERLNHMYFACPAVIAANMPQARSIFCFVAGLLKAAPLMRPKLVDETTETIATVDVAFGDGFRAPAFATVGRAPGPALESLPRRKPRGGWGTVWRACLWGFEDRALTSEASAIGDARCFQRKRRWLGFSMATMRGSEALASVAGGLATSRVRGARVAARGRRRRRSTVRGGMDGDGHELSILIRLGDGERQGRGPSSVSTMIIRPPQQGQRRAGETSSARLSASREGWGAFSAAASNCRARSMLSARSVPAMRP